MPAERVTLADALSAAPGMAIEFEQSVPTDGDPMPFLWATGDGHAEFEASIGNDPTVAETRLLDRVDGHSLFRVEWVDVDSSLLA